MFATKEFEHTIVGKGSSLSAALARTSVNDRACADLMHHGIVLDRKELQQSEQALADSQAKQQELARESQAQAQLGGPLPFNASLNPLTVHLPAQPPRQPSLRECEVIIRHLQMAGDKQTHEV